MKNCFRLSRNKKKIIITAAFLLVPLLLCSACKSENLPAYANGDQIQKENEMTVMDEEMPKISDDAESSDIKEITKVDLYGWWIIEDATGIYEDRDGNWLDAQARIYTDAENLSVEFIMWDERCEFTEENPVLILKAEIGETYSVKEVGFEGCSADASEFVVDDSEHGYNNLFFISGKCVFDDGEFIMYAFLRPWGILWDDISDDPLGTMPYVDMMPYHYEDFYIKKIKAGEEMPDSVY